MNFLSFKSKTFMNFLFEWFIVEVNVDVSLLYYKKIKNVEKKAFD
jgi:hypothetical protein